MKAVLGNRIYLTAKGQFKEWLNKQLTYVVPATMPNDPPLVIKNMGRITSELVSIPSGREDLIPKEYEIVDKRVYKPVEPPEFKFTLRESQQAVFDEIDDSAIINAWVSWGKTFTALAIAAKLKQKTLIVVHTVPLRTQWAREVEKVFGIIPGVIGSGTFEIGEFITIGNTQSLYRQLPKIEKEFGTIILDEMHHVSSPTFAKIIDANHARYKIGLSGTIERKDGKHVVFRDYFGSKIFKPPKENYMIPEIHIFRSNTRFMDGANIPWANRVNNLTSNEEYRHSVALLASSYAARGHKVLVVSDRVAFLKACAELVGTNAACVTGEVDQVQRESTMSLVEEGRYNVLFGTQAIFSEGISLNCLSCLILATPINNEPLLTQLIGRVVREDEGKLTPVILDIHLIGKTASSQASKRMGHYIKQGYIIKQL